MKISFLFYPRSSIESLTSDIKQLTGKVKAITLQTEKKDENFKMQMGHFLQVSIKY